MFAEGVTVAIIAKTSCGPYAGIFEMRINEEYTSLVEASLSEVIADGDIKRGHFFKHVIIAEKPKAVLPMPLAKRPKHEESMTAT